MSFAPNLCFLLVDGNLVLVTPAPLLAPFCRSSHCPHLIHSHSCWLHFQNIPRTLPRPTNLYCCCCPFSPGLLPWLSRWDLVTSSLKMLQCCSYLTQSQTRWPAGSVLSLHPMPLWPRLLSPLLHAPFTPSFNYHLSVYYIYLFFLWFVSPSKNVILMTTEIFVCLPFCSIPKTPE